MNKFDMIRDRFDYWLFDRFTLGPKEWALFRIGYALFILIWLGIPQLSYLAKLPDVFFHPHTFNIADLYPGFPSLMTSKILGMLMVIAYLCILFGFRTRTASVAAILLMVYSKSFVYSIGQINHDFMVWLVPLAGAIANWGSTYSLDAKRNPVSPETQNTGWPIMFLVIIFSFALALSGYKKYLGGWAVPDIAAVQQYLAGSRIVTPRTDFIPSFFVTVESRFFWKSLDYLTLIFEMGIVVGIIFPKVFRAFLFVAVGFHASNLLLLNIDFSFNLAFYGLFLNWAAIGNWMEQSPKAKALLKQLLSWKTFGLSLLGYLLFFYLTELPVAGFLLNLLGFEYLGNALARNLFGVAIALWAASYYFKKRRASQTFSSPTPNL